MSKHTAGTIKTQAPSSPRLLDITGQQLLRLSLREFKGIQKFDFEPNGRTVRVLGANGAGKSTLFDAWTFLLFGKDSLGRADFEVKRLLPDGTSVHGLDHEVEAVVDLDDSQRIKLKKVFRERWTRKRGQADREFAGHEAQYFADDVPIKESEYRERIAAIADEKAFRLLTSPVEFAERLHWQERRQVLLEVAGDITDTDVIASVPELADLTDILANRSIDDHRKVVQAQRRKINQELPMFGARIDEVSRGLPEIEGDTDKLKAELEALRIQRRNAETALSRIETGGEIAEKTKRLREIEAKILDEINKEGASRQAEVEKLRAELANGQAALDGSECSVRRLQRQITDAEKEANNLKLAMEKLRKNWHEADSEMFVPATGGDVCAACGQKIPAGQVEAAQARALAEFNSLKAVRLGAISEDGKILKYSAEVLTGKFEAWGKELLVAKAAQRACGEPVAKLKEEIATLTARQAHIPSDQEHEMLEQKRAVEAHIETLQEANLGAIEKAKGKIAGLDILIAEVELPLSKIEHRRLGEKRIERLGQEERRLAAEFEGLERQLYLLDEFTRQKVSLLTERINSRFELARFKLFNVLVNGGLEECCEVTHEGVPWPSLNTGAQINTGLDVIRTLSRHYGMAPPIFIDHSESVTTLLETPGQQIRLVVSESDKTLRVEEETR